MRILPLAETNLPKAIEDGVFNGRCRNRTCDPLIKSQQTENHKPLSDKALTETENPVLATSLASCCTGEAKDDADLQQVVEAWPKLPDAIRKKILLLGQGQKEIVKLVWGAKGYERTVVDTTKGR